MRVQVLLADAAQVDASGKLHTIGLGWNMTNATPAPLAVAALIFVPWTDANRKFKVRLNLIDGNGKPVLTSGPDRVTVVGMEQVMEVGRPAGAKPGSELTVPIACTFAGLRLEPTQAYEFRLFIDDETQSDWHAAFYTRPLGPTP